MPADVIDVIPKALGQTNRPGSSSVPHSPSVRFDIVPMGKRRAPVVDASAFATGQRCSENGGTCYGECGLVWHECYRCGFYPEEGVASTPGGLCAPCMHESVQDCCKCKTSLYWWDHQWENRKQFLTFKGGDFLEGILPRPAARAIPRPPSDWYGPDSSSANRPPQPSQADRCDGQHILRMGTAEVHDTGGPRQDFVSSGASWDSPWVENSDIARWLPQPACPTGIGTNNIIAGVRQGVGTPGTASSQPSQRPQVAEARPAGFWLDTGGRHIDRDCNPSPLPVQGGMGMPSDGKPLVQMTGPECPMPPHRAQSDPCAHTGRQDITGMTNCQPGPTEQGIPFARSVVGSEVWKAEAAQQLVGVGTPGPRALKLQAFAIPQATPVDDPWSAWVQELQEKPQQFHSGIDGAIAPLPGNRQFPGSLSTLPTPEARISDTTGRTEVQCRQGPAQEGLSHESSVIGQRTETPDSAPLLQHECPAGLPASAAGGVPPVGVIPHAACGQMSQTVVEPTARQTEPMSATCLPEGHRLQDKAPMNLPTSCDAAPAIETAGHKHPEASGNTELKWEEIWTTLESITRRVQRLEALLAHASSVRQQGQ